MKKKVVKKYRLKEGVKTTCIIIILLGVITTYLFYAADRVEKIENSGNTKQESVNINIIKK